LPYLRLLEDLIALVPGVKGALMLDALGEVVVEVGARDDQQRLIGAYQGIALATLQQATARHDLGRPEFLVCRYTAGSLILRPLKDGYYLLVSLAPDASLGRGIDFSRETQLGLDAEL
jgi:predicted regulator of Ras-like GTPase activity (Roadblock/LC7/MglB family)